MQQCCDVSDLKLDLIHSTTSLFLFSLAIDYTVSDAQQKTVTRRGSSAKSKKQKKTSEKGEASRVSLTRAELS